MHLRGIKSSAIMRNRDSGESEVDAKGKPDGKRKREEITDSDQYDFDKQPKRKPGQKMPWFEKEKAAVNKHFKRHICMANVPNKMEVMECQNDEPILRSREWRQVKDYVKKQGVTPARKAKKPK
ncbi:hypothetical protein CAPTEDRAFT_203026 [Capitella teleta]|uniref:Uncharacterized protein n=1 Tax=Capitella teleta TaxID=283909 RepID=R7TUI2_CAPTE|nr:hypothetical protein CAPTEDRAFT_203026 [Capitella teleta]|eukprot:ELT95136.1 hypothetical protein CAPTEDRAFT_203026 [Capitella teleta]